jgi:small multidrug resistance pump
MHVGLLLALAIGSEIAATVSLRSVHGLSTPVPLAIVVAGYSLSFVLLAIVVKQLSVGTTYAIWSGAGTAVIAAIGMFAMGEPATALRIASIGLIIAGVIGLNLGGSAH